MGVHFQPHAGHADRVADAFLRVVEHVVARDRVQDLLVGRDRDGLGRLQHPVEVVEADLAVADRRDALRVAALHVAAGNRGVDRADLARSEEHTSELQSLMRISYAVFCLKKKKTSKGIQNNAKEYITTKSM